MNALHSGSLTGLLTRRQAICMLPGLQVQLNAERVKATGLKG